jgi:hypothetical protein
MDTEDKTLLLVEDDRPLRAERRPSRSGRQGLTVSDKPRDHKKRASAP